MALNYATLNNLSGNTGHYQPMPDPDCYIYLHHVDTMIILPSFGTANNDSINVSFVPNTPLARTAPIYSYQNSGPRTLQVNFDLHRDMIYELNYDNIQNSQIIERSTQNTINVNTGREQEYVDYVDVMAKQIQAAALPTYALQSKMVNPPLVSLKLGNDIFIKGVVQGGVGVYYDLPILANGKYAKVNISFSISEVVPYEATQVMQFGSYRGLDTTLSSKNYYISGSN